MQSTLPPCHDHFFGSSAETVAVQPLLLLFPFLVGLSTGRFGAADTVGVRGCLFAACRSLLPMLPMLTTCQEPRTRVTDHEWARARPCNGGAGGYGERSTTIAYPGDIHCKEKPCRGDVIDSGPEFKSCPKDLSPFPTGPSQGSAARRVKIQVRVRPASVCFTSYVCVCSSDAVIMNKVLTP